MLASDLDELLVQRDSRHAHRGPRRGLGAVEHRAPHGVVAARVLVGAVRGGALHAKLVAVVQTRDALHEQQDDHRVEVVLRVGDVRSDARDVVVAEKVDQREAAEEAVFAKQRVVKVLVVAIVQREPRSVRHLVVRAGVQAVVPDPVVVVPVDHLADEEAILPQSGVVAHRAKLAPKVGLDLVRDVEAPPVDAHLVDPEPRDVEDVLLHVVILQV
eukprot:30915-Pelagococcus_subviridis.AAC.3